MARTLIRGNTQIQAGTISNTEIASDAAIATSKLADSADFVIAGTAVSQDIVMNSNKITGLGAGTNAGDAVNKAQLDAVSAGLDPKESVRAATTAPITLNGLQTVDTVVLVAGDRVLVKDQGTASQNGIYTVVDGGAWTRTPDANVDPELSGGTFTFVEAGTQAGQGFVIVADGDITIGVTNVNWTQFSGGASYTAAANGAIDITANEISVNVDDSSIEITTNALNVKALGITTGMLQADSVTAAKINADVAGIGLTPNVTTGALDITLDTNSGLVVGADTLAIQLNGSTLALGATGISVAAAGITETQLNTSVAGNGITGGGGAALAVDTGVVQTAAKYIVRDIPAETPNDAITAFTFNGGSAVVAGSEMIFLNGQLLEDAGEDYTFVAATGVATFTFVPATGDRITATFYSV